MKLIFSTKGLYTSKNLILPLFLYIFASVCLFIGYPNLLDSIIGYIIAMGFILIFIFPFSRAIQIKKSYIELYEDYIVGFSIPKKYFSFTPDACNFKLHYSDITHITFQKGIVEIYFQNGSYLVQAKDCEQKVIEIINSQKSLY